jgi:hypothetical protein
MDTVIDFEEIRDKKRERANKRKKMRNRDEKKWKQDCKLKKTRMEIPGL